MKITILIYFMQCIVHLFIPFMMIILINFLQTEQNEKKKNYVKENVNKKAFVLIFFVVFCALFIHSMLKCI